MNKVQDAVVDMYEQLPVPYGLVRFGVAPDHPEVKNCQDTFEEAAKSPLFNYIGNVRVGYDVELAKMKPHYDAILFSYGASEDKKLGIPGEETKGVYSAREFVGWYNGLPQFQHLAPDLASGDKAVVIGQGNVALDVARILLTPVDKLRHTDITEQALQTLSQSRVKDVKVVGRRGPLQVSFTVKEVRELMHIEDVAFRPVDLLADINPKKLPRVQRRITELLKKGTESLPQGAQRSWGLEFLQSPKSMNATESNQLSSVTFTKQAYAPDADSLSPTASVVSTNETSTLPASFAFRSVGYKSVAIPGFSDLGIPFDTKLGIIPNDPYGRIITSSAGPGNLTAGHLPGLYCAGWVKRGPTGVIASTMADAFTSADVIAEDWNANVPFLNSERSDNRSTGLGWEGVRADVEAKGVRALSWEDWKRIDLAERQRGEKKGKLRDKFGSVEEMLQVLDT
ncbi:FAD/NAD(P)-binding domain-containing protein [Pleomassaria siparia CBS 279.74]|uniref:NADPH:adrenodoxin oxidoreductase, mitochondrial n=1 Tax=Pleomassaria siparia CBS 279.74 TaxID=1314801 RepID=A0A6G1K8B6_9PLEO|nr:FAD/NAD(P)-binding domain-containing protein [Pleomassaria siparia CBS 279.74]